MKPPLGALLLARQIRDGCLRAEAVMAATLADISARDSALHCFTQRFDEEALNEARRLDLELEAGLAAGPLAGVPFAVKDLYDIAGHPTCAGSVIRRNVPSACRDATLIRRLKQAGAILVGTLNMDEFAYGFSTENAHYGTTRNPHDPGCIAGGSSGGSAAAVAAGLVPFTLGSDTNGSIRVPASLCGVFGMKPTFGRLPRTGIAALSASLDHAGHFARSAEDLAVIYGCMLGPDADDPTCHAHPPDEPDTGRIVDLKTLRVGVLDGWFREGAEAQVLDATDAVAAAFRHVRRVTLPEAARARAAAFCITAAEAGNLHLSDLRARARDFDAATRGRLLAGALLPANILLQAQRFRSVFRAQVAALFLDYDILLAPTTPCVAPRIGQDTMAFGGMQVGVRANLGIYTQPLSFIGLPVISAPMLNPGTLPVGVQIIGKAWSEKTLLSATQQLEARGVIATKLTPSLAA